MTKIIDAIVETYTNTTELYIRSNNLDRFAKADGWQVVDTLRFHCERKLKREIQDLEFWITRQADREANAKRWAQRDRKKFTGDESTTNLQSSTAQWKAEQFGLQVIQAELAAAQEAFKKLTGKSYTSIEDQADAELPEDIAAMFAEMDALEAASEDTPPKRKRKA
jgi:tRNA U34 5-carboxymethylaminomethyl modifying GTPase MnmE/TrmE